MLGWFLRIVIFLLIAEHIIISWGPDIINAIASRYSGQEVEVVKKDPDRKSILEKTYEKIKDFLEELRK